MNLNGKFSIWCAKKCLPLWDPPKEIVDWLDDPENIEKAHNAYYETRNTGGTPTDVAWAAARGVKDSIYGRWPAGKIEEVQEEQWTAWLSERAAEALDIPHDILKQEFVSSLTDEELKTTDPAWIEYATVEVFSR